jgi:putative methionine-R-sulfoxide reductase with GAF domain
VETNVESVAYMLNIQKSAREGEARSKLIGLGLRRYGLALLFVFAALISTLLLQHLFPYPFLFLFCAAVMASAWFGGTGSGLFAVVLSTVVADYFFIRPFYSLAVDATDGAYFVAFVACALAASWLSSSKKKSEGALKEARNDLQILVAERTSELHKSNIELQENERGLRLLAELIPQQFRGETLNASSDVPVAASLQEVSEQVADFAVSLVRCDSCFVYVLEDDELVLRASNNPHPEAVNWLKLKLGQGITGWVAEHRQPVTVAQKASQDPRFQLFNELPEDRFEAFLSVPVLSRGRLVCVINLQNREPHRYNEREVRLLSTIGFLAGAEIEMARLETENSQLSEKLAARKLMERAKGILQRELKINEEDAYLTLQRESRKRGKSMKEIAESILLNDSIKRPKEKASS